MIAQKLKHIADNMQAVYDAGKNLAQKECGSKHYTTVISGSGSTELTVPLDFEPDLITISNNDPDIRATPGVVSYVQIDLSALGQLAGIFCITNGPGTGTNLGSYTNALLAANGIPSRYRRNEDGTVSVGNLPFGSDYGVWDKALDYTVIAAKCVEKSDKERITQIIHRLPEGKSYKIHIWEDKKDAAFTEQEWNDLIATKSTYTFVMV